MVFGVLLTLASPLLAQDKNSGIPADTEIKTTPSGLKYSVLKAGKGELFKESLKEL